MATKTSLTKSSGIRKNSTPDTDEATDIVNEVIAKGKEVVASEKNTRQLDYEAMQRMVELANRLSASTRLWAAFIGHPFWETAGARPSAAKRPFALKFVLRMHRGKGERANKAANLRYHVLKYLLESEGVAVADIATELRKRGGVDQVNEARLAEEKPEASVVASPPLEAGDGPVEPLKQGQGKRKTAVASAKSPPSRQANKDGRGPFEVHFMANIVDPECHRLFSVREGQHVLISSHFAGREGQMYLLDVVDLEIG